MTDKVQKIREEVERLRKSYQIMYQELECESPELMSVCAKRNLCQDILMFIDSMQKEPKECMYSKDNFTDEDRKVLCDGCEEKCKFNKKEEPVSEDIQKVGSLKSLEYYPEKKTTNKTSKGVFDANMPRRKAYLRGFKDGAHAHKELIANKPVSGDLEAAIDNYLATYFGGEKEKQEWPFLKKMAIHFAAWQKQQMMAKAVDADVVVDRIGEVTYLCPHTKATPYKKVKVIVIKKY